jgi:Fic family protein
MALRETGLYTPVSFRGGTAQAFIPYPLPPADPPLILSLDLQAQMERASLALGRLDRLIDEFPDPNLLIRFYQRKEAVVSSQIEGTVTTLTDLLLHELDGSQQSPAEDARLNANYFRAIEHGVEASARLPLSKRLIRELHGVLLAGTADEGKTPGEFRRVQNAVVNAVTGEMIHLPPPPDQLEACMDALEQFLNSPAGELPTLLKAALAHVQFETIHPFLDGNGRVGRMLITLLLYIEGVLRQPILYLSLHFKAHRTEYYRCLRRVRTDGDWEGWMAFFYGGVERTASQAVAAAMQIRELFDRDRQRLAGLGRAAENLLRTLEVLQLKPLLTAADLRTELNVTLPTALAVISKLTELRILEPVNERERGQVHSYAEYLRILNEGTAPLEG